MDSSTINLAALSLLPKIPLQSFTTAQSTSHNASTFTIAPQSFVNPQPNTQDTSTFTIASIDDMVLDTSASLMMASSGRMLMRIGSGARRYGSVSEILGELSMVTAEVEAEQADRLTSMDDEVKVYKKLPQAAFAQHFARDVAAIKHVVAAEVRAEEAQAQGSTRAPRTSRELRANARRGRSSITRRTTSRATSRSRSPKRDVRVRSRSSSPSVSPPAIKFTPPTPNKSPKSVRFSPCTPSPPASSHKKSKYRSRSPLPARFRLVEESGEVDDDLESEALEYIDYF